MKTNLYNTVDELDIDTPNEAAAWVLEKMFKGESIRKACARLAKQAGIGGEYLRQVAFYGKRPSQKTMDKILVAAGHKSETPNTITTRYPPHEEADRQAALALTMAERREAFRRYVADVSRET